MVSPEEEAQPPKLNNIAENMQTGERTSMQVKKTRLVKELKNERKDTGNTNGDKARIIKLLKMDYEHHKLRRGRERNRQSGCRKYKHRGVWRNFRHGKSRRRSESGSTSESESRSRSQSRLRRNCKRYRYGRHIYKRGQRMLTMQISMSEHRSASTEQIETAPEDKETEEKQPNIEIQEQVELKVVEKEVTHNRDVHSTGSKYIDEKTCKEFESTNDRKLYLMLISSFDKLAKFKSEQFEILAESMRNTPRFQQLKVSIDNLAVEMKKLETLDVIEKKIENLIQEAILTQVACRTTSAHIEENMRSRVAEREHLNMQAEQNLRCADASLARAKEVRMMQLDMEQKLQMWYEQKSMEELTPKFCDACANRLKKNNI